MSKSHNPNNFNTSVSRIREGGEINSGEQLTEQAGYIPLNIQLARLDAAGVQLYNYRKEMYDFGEGEPIPANAEDPTRTPNYDMADASTALRDLEKKYTERKRFQMEQESINEKDKEDVLLSDAQPIPEEETPNE